METHDLYPNYSPLRYVIRELGIRSDEWVKLDRETQEGLKRMAEDEIFVRLHAPPNDALPNATG